MKEALLFHQEKNFRVRCQACNHYCLIQPDQTGICRVRKNIGGTLCSLNYDKVTAIHNDPIEKKPLYHFLPGSQSLSIAAMGCNFRCTFCQNYSISVVENDEQILGEAIKPQTIVDSALKIGSQSISYTYTEPTIFIELMQETSALAREKGLKNVMVTNGYMSREAFLLLQPTLDAANVDLKSFSEKYYQKYCGAKLKPVLETIERMKAANIWVEVTTLVVTGLNEDDREIDALIDYLLKLDPLMPWHISRFFPQHKENHRSPTDPQKLLAIAAKAKDRGLKYVYVGNILSDQYSQTFCPQCHETVIARRGYSISSKKLQNGHCGNCQQPIAGRW